MTKHISATLAALFVAVAVIAADTRAQAPPSLEQVLEGVRAAEKVFTNLYIKDFRTTVDLKAAGEADWKPTPMVYAGSAWYDGDPQGSVRIYFAQQVLPWERRPGEFGWAGQEVDYSWDGKEGREVHVASGFPRASRRDNSAMIYPDRPPMLSAHNRYMTGAGYAVQYLVMDQELMMPRGERRLISELIEKSVTLKTPPELSQQKINGYDAVRLHWPGVGGSSQSYWFAVSHGFALLRDEWVLKVPGESSSEILEVNELKQVAPGVWFPIRATKIDREGGKPGSYRRYNYTAAAAVANDPKFDPAIFSVSIPVGYMVGDTRGERRDYIILKDGTEHELKRGSILPAVKAVKPRRPDAKE